MFQLDQAELDFGIYRIMNYKRDSIQKFINDDLPKGIAEELNRDALRRQSRAAEELAKVGTRVRETLGEGALDADGRLLAAYRDTPVGKEYEALKTTVAGAMTRERLESTIYNHLHTFFSRYYEDGDVISKRRYSKREKYAIPYNGEEVHLHWANSDQHYVKTAEYFHNYAYAARGVTVHFGIRSADVEQNNVKGEKRFFLPLLSEVEWDADEQELVVPFEYRPLTKEEESNYGNRGQQDAINAEVSTGLPGRLSGIKAVLPALTAERHKDSDGNPVSHLTHHLRQYTRRNTSDYFIHKNLKVFLSRELDFYLKNEVLNLDAVEGGGEDQAEGWFQMMRTIKRIGDRIITFLDQIESFQKLLWEKRKFVVESQYCITVGEIDRSFYPEIGRNEAQWAEWNDFFGIAEEVPKLFSSDKGQEKRRLEFLVTHPTLVVDTKHFDDAFVDRVLGSFENLDELLDGLLIHSENFQALQLLQERFRGGIQCVYIDPPFNTGTDEFLYKDGYQHSSWLAMMSSRVELATALLATDGTFYAHIDYTEKERLKLLLDRYLHYVTEIIWRIGWVSGYKSAANKFIRNHDTIYQYGKNETPLFIKTYIPYPEGYTRRDGNPPSGEGYPLEDTWNCSDLDKLHSVQIMSFSKEKIGNQALTQKNENLLARMIGSSSRPGDLVLDYFLGSGTTAAVAHKMGRKYVGIEMDHHFYDFALPRMKRVLYGDPYGVSPEVGWKGGGAFQYVKLESFEDTLTNIEFDGAVMQETMDFEDYCLRYMLRWETRESDTLLNADRLVNPFRYSLRIHEDREIKKRVIDVPETFNYLIGLRVERRQTFWDDDRRYLVYKGKMKDRDVVVIWRDTEKWTKEDFARDRAFVKKEEITEGADDVFINGDSVVPNAKALEPVMKGRLFASMDR
ncbi:MAG: site-specific DNA-methyltransferase [Gemmatimonadota bacterium]